jgi:hypothetical protein
MAVHFGNFDTPFEEQEIKIYLSQLYLFAFKIQDYHVNNEKSWPYFCSTKPEQIWNIQKNLYRFKRIPSEFAIPIPNAVMTD